MQVPDPTPDHIWNWRLNVEKGIEIFNERVAAAGEYPSKVRNSEEFNRLVAQFNQRRQQQGLNPIQVVLPDFATGNFDDNLQQLELDAIRGYNGWNGSDRFGLELHEFRVAVDRIEGEEVLIVANVNEETLQGEADWERVPVADRPTAIGAPNYVEEVLAFDFGCSSAPTLTCPVVDIIVDPSDTRTHAIPDAFGGLRPHFVTVKGTGDIVLRATIIPDTPQFRSLLTWEADGVTSPALGANRLTAKISRNTLSGARIPVRIKLGSDICTERLVWIIWCTLAPKTDPAATSSITPEPLGVQNRRVTEQGGGGGYVSEARIDWTATIHPAAIITDNMNRPLIEKQPRVAPPGDDRGVAGFPAPNNVDNTDATGSGFSGWDMSRQRRQRVFKGNPIKVPPVAIAETKADDFNPEDRPIPKYPANEVEGNDDDRCTDEDSNPYDQGGGIPGLGTRGTLRSTDKPDIDLFDHEDHTGRPNLGVNGDTYRLRNHFREFVRVQLGGTWYRCSEFGLWRWHMFAQRLNGQWNLEPPLIDELKADNDGFDL